MLLEDGVEMSVMAWSSTVVECEYQPYPQGPMEVRSSYVCIKAMRALGMSAIVGVGQVVCHNAVFVQKGVLRKSNGFGP